MRSGGKARAAWATIGLGCVLCALSVAQALGHTAGTEANPNVVSELRGIEPPLEGVRVRVLGRADRLELENSSGRTVAVIGYFGEQFVRIRGNGAVELNERSPTKRHLEDPDAPPPVQPSRAAKAKPRWVATGDRGRYEWHDQRSTYSGQLKPPQVIDETVRSKISEWRIPIISGGRRAVVRGTLFWDPGEDSGLPVAILLAVAGGVLAAIASLLLLRRRGRPTTAQS